ncbi:MAG: hypothetical protein M4579_005873 [Chaenotheca gracillima]|nr:MAG: hypothetical protein M4579_005873 [Chaenotheca gracillima]
MILLQELPFDVAERVYSKLAPSDLARVAGVSRTLHASVVPVLYRNVHFQLPAIIKDPDRLLHQLETFTDPGFDLLKHTLSVTVSGAWYHKYDELDATIGQGQLVPPAIKMLNTLIVLCIIKMPHLKKFCWDAFVPPDQRLLSKLAWIPRLDTLQIRLSSNHTPTPYFYPSLKLHDFRSLRCLNLFQVNKSPVLQSIGVVFNRVQHLVDVALWADVDARLPLGPLFKEIDRSEPLPLQTLDLRGFATFGYPEISLWSTFSPITLVNLTIEVGHMSRPEEVDDIWQDALAANVRPSSLAINHITPSLIRYLASFQGLRTLHLMPHELALPIGPFVDFIKTVVTAHDGSLHVLGIFPPDINSQAYLLDAQLLTWVVQRCPRLTEFGFGVAPDQIDRVSLLFGLFQLRVLHIQVVAQNPTAGTKSEGNVDGADPVARLCDVLVGGIKKGLCPELTYVAFDEGPLCYVGSASRELHVMSEYIPRIRNTTLFGQRMLQWMDDVF